MIKPWNLKIWALGWWNQANQILIYDRQVRSYLITTVMVESIYAQTFFGFEIDL